MSFFDDNEANLTGLGHGHKSFHKKLELEALKNEYLKGDIIVNTKKEGQFTGKVTKVGFIEHRFAEGEMEIAIDFITEENEDGKIYLDLSNKIITAGNNAGKKQSDASLETLTAIGIDLANQGASAITTLEGQMISVFGKVNGSGYLNFYLNTRKPETAMLLSNADAKLKSLFAAPTQGSGFGQQEAPPQQGSGFTQPQQNSGFSNPQTT